MGLFQAEMETVKRGYPKSMVRRTLKCHKKHLCVFCDRAVIKNTTHSQKTQRCAFDVLRLQTSVLLNKTYFTAFQSIWMANLRPFGNSSAASGLTRLLLNFGTFLAKRLCASGRGVINGEPVYGDYFLACSSLSMTGPYLARLLPALIPMEIASASESSSWFAPARTACL